jgi:hypothetical protein
MVRQVGHIYKITDEESNRSEATWYICMDLGDDRHAFFIDEYYADAYEKSWYKMQEGDIDNIDKGTMKVLLRKVFGDAR